VYTCKVMNRDQSSSRPNIESDHGRSSFFIGGSWCHFCALLTYSPENRQTD
jgi:hypothetical protein